MKKNKLPYHSKAGFKVPDHYFDDLETRLLDISSSDLNLANSMEKGNPGFKVPANYFEEMENKVLQRIAKEPKGGKLISLLNRKMFYYAAAIAAILILVVPSSLLKPTPGSEFSMDEVEMSSIEYYINNGYIDFNFNEISSFIYEEDYVLEEFNTSNISDEDVFYYLSENVENSGFLIE